MARLIELEKFFDAELFDAELFEDLEKITSHKEIVRKIATFLGAAMKGSKGQFIPFSESLDLLLRVRHWEWG